MLFFVTPTCIFLFGDVFYWLWFCEGPADLCSHARLSEVFWLHLYIEAEVVEAQLAELKRIKSVDLFGITCQVKSLCPLFLSLCSFFFSYCACSFLEQSSIHWSLHRLTVLKETSMHQCVIDLNRWQSFNLWMEKQICRLAIRSINISKKIKNKINSRRKKLTFSWRSSSFHLCFLFFLPLGETHSWTHYTRI